MSIPGQVKAQLMNISLWSFVKLGLLILGVWFLWFVRDIVGMVFIALLLAALIDPFADWFQRHHIPRGLAVIIVYIVLGGIVGAMFVLLAPVVIEQVVQLATNFGLGEGLRVHLIEARDAIVASVSSILESPFTTSLPTSFTSVFSTVWGVFAGVAALLIVLVLAFYMVVEEASARKYFRHLAPAEYQPFLSQMFAKMQSKIGMWLRAQLILGIVIGVTVYIGLSLIGVKYALLLALVAGFLEFIPYAGPVLSTIPAVIIGFAQSPLTGLLVLALYLLIQQLENNVLVPKIMQKVTGLNPIISIVALLIGVKVGGFVGAILAVPVATVVAVVLEELFDEYSFTSKRG